MENPEVSKKLNKKFKESKSKLFLGQKIPERWSYLIKCDLQEDGEIFPHMRDISSICYVIQDILHVEFSPISGREKTKRKRPCAFINVEDDIEFSHLINFSRCEYHRDQVENELIAYCGVYSPFLNHILEVIELRLQYDDEKNMFHLEVYLTCSTNGNITVCHHPGCDLKKFYVKIFDANWSFHRKLNFREHIKEEMDVAKNFHNYGYLKRICTLAYPDPFSQEEN